MVAGTALAALCCLISSRVALTSAAFVDSAAVGTNSFGTATLQPPAAPTATGSCAGPAPRVTVSWTAAALADGYDVFRGTQNGGPYSFRAHVTTTSYQDTAVIVNTTYRYVVTTTRNDWDSANSVQATASTPLVCL